MPDTPSQWMRFRRQDIKPLHDMPSAQAHDPVIVRGHHPRKPVLRKTLAAAAVVAAAMAGLVGLGLAAIEGGLADGPLKARAQAALANAAGDGGSASVGSAVVRMTSEGKLALVARDVTVRPGGSLEENRVDEVSLALDALPLLAGQLKVSSISVEGAALSLPGTASGSGAQTVPLRIDSTGDLIEAAFAGLNRAVDRIEAAETASIRFSGLRLSSGEGRTLVIEEAALIRETARRYRVDASIAVGGQTAKISANAERMNGRQSVSRLSGTLSGLMIDVASEKVVSDNPFEARGTGITTGLTADFTMVRASGDRPPQLRLTLEADGGGSLLLGGVDASLDELKIEASYEAGPGKIEVLPSVLAVGETRLPFTGAIIDIDRLPQKGAGPGEGNGYAFDLVVSPGVAAPGDSNEAPIPFEAKAFGRFLPAERKLIASELLVASGSGAMTGSASFQFAPGESPGFTVVASTDRMATAAVKQLWPYWMGKRARQWVLNNLYGGTVRDGTLQVSVPVGFFKPGERPTFDASQLQIGFSIERARMNVAGDIPPLRDTVGRVRIAGSDLDVRIDSATGYFPTGRSVDVANASFSVPDTTALPVMADLAMSVSGEADAVAELITYHPINVLDRIGRVPDEFSGMISADVTARFGLVQDQNPPPPDWAAELALKGVDISAPVDGRKLQALDGVLKVSPVRADLNADARVDGVPLRLDVVQPVGNSTVTPFRRVSGVLDDKAREVLAPGSGAALKGPIGFEMEIKPDKPSAVSLDLRRAVVTVPGAGWVKEAGVAAKATFNMMAGDDRVTLDDLSFSGQGFSAKGALNFRNGSLSRARFSSVRLAPQDDYTVDVTASGNGYKVALGGRSFDARALIASAKKEAAADARGRGGGTIEVEGRAGTVYGFNGETLGNVSINYRARGSRVDRLDLRGVTRSGQAVVLGLKTSGGVETLEATSGDAGAFIRFAGIYERMAGGLLNVRLTGAGDGRRRGVVDIRNFEVRGEPRLQSLVSSPSGQNGQSLNDAVKGRIDAGQARFEIASARVATAPGRLDVSDGIVRGPEIGAAFNGTAYDANGRIDLTGTFMPAYGINRLFGDLPLIGALLGNGREGGLIGITFRLTGKASSPTVEINPLSAIAPGIFRSIFEFRR